MSKDKTFTDIMKKPDATEQAELWGFVMAMAQEFEDEHGYSRKTVCEGILRAVMDLIIRREDEQFFQKTNDVRHFYLWASDFTKRKFDTYTSYEEQREEESDFGKDNLGLRDAKNFGWKDEENTSTH